MNDILNIIIQCIISIILIILLAIAGYAIYNYDVIRASNTLNTIKKQTMILEGITDLHFTTNLELNTQDKTKTSYVDLSPSINQSGGAEYTYNFWMYRNKSFDQGLYDKVLLLRGNKTKYNYSSNNCYTSEKPYILVKNPLIRIKGDGSAIIVEYNTVTNPESFHINGKDSMLCSKTDWKKNNQGLLGIYDLDSATYDKSWFMVTISLKETTPNNDILYNNNTNCKIYINGVVMLDRIVESAYDGSTDGYGSTAMRQNTGPLYVGPTSIFKNTDDTDADTVRTEKSLQLANISYFNYAITTPEVEALYNLGFSKFSSKIPNSDNSSYVISSPFNPLQNTNNDATKNSIKGF